MRSSNSTRTLVVYTSPFVPPEWIAAHGLHPSRIVPDCENGKRPAPEGMCGLASAMLDAAPHDAAALILATTCDQMRRAAERDVPAGCQVFLLNVPATWQSASAARLYADELKRLGRFLESLGGRWGGPEALAEAMNVYDSWRERFRSVNPRLKTRRHAEFLDGFYRHGAGASLPETDDDPIGGGVPLMLLGGPLCRSDWAILDALESAGGRVVLDGTETGERTWPAPFDKTQIRANAFDVLTQAYFGSIPDVFRRPNDVLYRWIDERVRETEIRGGILFRRRWCDLWIGESQRIREALGLPLLELDLDGDAKARARGRIEAYLEMLR